MFKMKNNLLYMKLIVSTGILIYIHSKIVSADDNMSRRILFHSSEDLATEITNLKVLVQSLTTEITNLKALVQISEARITESMGSTYVRWGRTVCPQDNELVHKGYVSGRKYDSHGSGTDTLCLPEEPTWKKFHDGDESQTVYRAYIYGAEIDTNDEAHIFSYAVNQQDIPCALCRTNRTAIAMIPARDVCYPGWTAEYSGYLMAGSSQRVGHNHVCMDTNPEFVAGGGGNDNEHILYLTEGSCGSLPCPPYVNGRELSCVVCSK